MYAWAISNTHDLLTDWPVRTSECDILLQFPVGEL
jgi:hypothetical protein